MDKKWKTNWTKCCLCQQDKKEELRSPASNPAVREKDGYQTIATNIPLFVAINNLPIALDPDRLDEGDGLEETFRKNNAVYHQSCRLLFSNSKLERARKRSAKTESPTGINDERPKKQRTTALKEACFLCEKFEKEGVLRNASTMKLNERLNQCARTLNDGKLIARLSAGDVVAQELKYHTKCLASLYNRERSHLCAQESSTNCDDNSEKNCCSIAFSELVTYINESCNSGLGPHTFRLADLVTLYKERLEQLLGVDAGVVNSTRLKEQLLLHLPELEAYHRGRDVLLAFNSDIGSFIEHASNTCDAIHLAKSASMLRKDMLNHKWALEKTLDGERIEESVPPSLLEFVCMIEHGADIKSQINNRASKSDLALAQLLQFNCFAKYKDDATSHRHTKARETPFAVYLGLSVFAKTRKRQLIDMLYENGLSISYDRVLEISSQLGEAVVNQYVEEGVVCPPELRKGLFTTSAMDNIDHNPTATTAQSSFHGTSISVFQHPTSDNIGETRMPLKVGYGKTKKVPELPESYTNIQPAYLKEVPKPPVVESFVLPDVQSIAAPEFQWLEKVSVTEEVDENIIVTWSAHNASQRRDNAFEVTTCISSLLPLLRDEAHSVATIKHAMNKIRDIVFHLNPTQVPVIAADQPLYALAKQIQWQWPEYGENKFVIMFGGLHIEMAALRSVGSMLQDSGWSDALTEAQIASSGTVQSFLSASSVTRTRQAHQVTLSTLYRLKKNAYDHYIADEAENSPRLD